VIVAGLRRFVGAGISRIAPERQTFKSDLIAGLPGAIGSVPDGMAASVLAGVSPVHGLYASFAGPIGGGLGVSSRLMVVTTTSAAALAAGSALRGLSAADRAGSLVLLTAIAGGLMLLAGVLKLGRYVRFVSHSVMIGFLAGIAVNIIAGQLGDLTGTEPVGSVAVARGLDVLLHPSLIDPAALGLGLGAIALMLVLARTPVSRLAPVLALAVPTVVSVLAGLDGVATVADAGEFPRGLPIPRMPELRHLTPDLVFGALAVAVVVLVQGAGVSQSVPNPDGTTSDTNADFAGQGLGNLASSLFQGQPVGGSVGQTALNVAAGASSRWASIWSGVWMAVVLVALSGVVGRVVMPTLAAVLIVASFGAFRTSDVAAIFRTGNTSRTAMVVSFAATLVLPVAPAVGLGVVISLLMQLNQEAVDLRVVQLVVDGPGCFREVAPPGDLESRQVTVLDVYGSLLYAGPRTLQARLPDPASAESPVVVLRLRGRSALGATFFAVVSAYADALSRTGGLLYISGVDPSLAEQMRRNGALSTRQDVKLFEAVPTLGLSTSSAVADAEMWLYSRDRSGPSALP